jgi:hypothetical protein
MPKCWTFSYAFILLTIPILIQVLFFSNITVYFLHFNILYTFFSYCTETITLFRRALQITFTITYQ